jgi:rare lipoprotein A
MRLPNSRSWGRFLPLILVAALSACGGNGDRHLASAPATPPANGPAADYPVVIGAPYTVADVSYEPEDRLNYDKVGYAALDPKGGSTISGENHTLPLPSYVEVTSLQTGKTILIRLERRGPMDGNQLIGLSEGAMEQLGATAGTPVRVRRVNPPEEERALLRAGKRAPERIDTPMSLVDVLRRKLPGGEGPVTAPSTDLTRKGPSTVPVPPSAANPAPAPSAASNAVAVAPKPAIASDANAAPTPPKPQPVAASSSPPLPPLEQVGATKGQLQPVTISSPQQQDFPWIKSTEEPKPVTVAEQSHKPATPKAVPPKAPPPKAAPSKGYVVQAGAFSTHKRAQKVAETIDGRVSPTGSLYRVRTGPFASRKEAEASLAKVRAAGYSDARIFWSG